MKKWNIKHRSATKVPATFAVKNQTPGVLSGIKETSIIRYLNYNSYVSVWICFVLRQKILLRFFYYRPLKYEFLEKVELSDF